MKNKTEEAKGKRRKEWVKEVLKNLEFGRRVKTLLFTSIE
jgi:hypothetical protein